MGLAINNQNVEVPGLNIVSYLQNPKLRLSSGDRRTRNTKWVRSIIIHTTMGIDPTIVIPGFGPDLKADERIVEYYNSDPEHNGCHICIDADASIGCYADLLLDTTYHATSINEVSVGIEIKQTVKGEIWQAQIDAVVVLVDAITNFLGIQRQVHYPYTKYRPVPRLVSGGKDAIGVFGHRDQTTRRGPGDPGDPVFDALRESGYLAFDYVKDEDLDFWRRFQKRWKLSIDGVPGPSTTGLIKKFKKSGLFVDRPIDLLL